MEHWTKHLVVALGFSLLFVAAMPASADALDPRAFAPVGPFPTAAGTYTFDTNILDSTIPTLNGPNGVLLTGVVYNGIAVFDFSTITVNSNQVFVGAGAPLNALPGGLPLALLSRGDINVNGTIDVSARDPFGGPGGYSGGFSGGGGPGAGANGQNTLDTNGSGITSSPGGGGFGGSGGNGGFASFSHGSPTGVIPFGGAPGGGSYGNLANSLQGGSSGGTSTLSRAGGPFPGGGGGGAIEVGAVGGITVRGSILANGGFYASGGSGGGIYLHSDSVALLGVLSAQGGGSSAPGGGGGGGGGRVLIQAGPGGFNGNVGGINISGGNGSSFDPFSEAFSAAGDPGIVTISGTVVPEPASLVLLGVGMLGVLGCTWGSRLKREQLPLIKDQAGMM